MYSSYYNPGINDKGGTQTGIYFDYRGLSILDNEPVIPLPNYAKIYEKEIFEDFDEDINYKCPLCLKDGKGIYRDGIIYPCKTCQKIEDKLPKHNTTKSISKQLI